MLILPSVVHYVSPLQTISRSSNGLSRRKVRCSTCLRPSFSILCVNAFQRSCHNNLFYIRQRNNILYVQVTVSRTELRIRHQCEASQCCCSMSSRRGTTSFQEQTCSDGVRGCGVGEWLVRERGAMQLLQKLTCKLSMQSKE